MVMTTEAQRAESAARPACFLRCAGPKGCGHTARSGDFYSDRGRARCPACGKNHTYAVVDAAQAGGVGSRP